MTDSTPVAATVVRFPVTVVMERKPVQGSRWVTYSWNATGVVVSAHAAAGWKLVRSETGSGAAEFLFGGLELRLHKDECESYYHNLLSETPRLYIVTREDEPDERPRPFIVTASFDEAHAYLEAEEGVFEAPIPPEVYRAVEAFVLSNYVPEKRLKRKRQDWRKGEP